MTDKTDSSPIEIKEEVVEDDEASKAKRAQGSFRDVDLKAALERLLGESGSADMFELIYTASKKGKKLRDRWWERSIWIFIGSIVSIAIAVKVYFF